MLGLTQEVTTLKQMMKDLLIATRQKQAPQIPEELFEHYERLTDNKVSSEIATDIINDSYEWMVKERDEVRLVAGDGDYVPVIENLARRGFPCVVVFWSHASRELREAAGSS